MTEPENFEDDLFDDLYNDDEPAKAAPPPPPPEPAPPAAEPVTKHEDESANSIVQHLGGDTGGDYNMNGNEEYEEDDDDVDFNLGNDESHASETPSYHNSAPAPAPHKGPNAKEDG
ncbi:hypothetical protein M406DRAFT_358202 [Cryphonectria parasitica EP155]|uniref:Uncharacterized protein n=1 Tax=Cryphonectria parasitica (strain ATCC 38755 / EP155) TaxID=660469 RepID=A0A9P5CK84_CRYP1|nr:uncharacterized protein M406DRAFT_358202 [Cryphonectria parasitica EP155]KAF3760490.1 hypothetical protein M406DRAFT_358202 [Cryphonectria parasitica EP155]